MVVATAVVSAPAGKGRLITCGFLPGLSYIKPALAARKPLEQRIEQERTAESADQPEATNAAQADQVLKPIAGIPLDDQQRMLRSLNPWQFPAEIRNCLLTPVRLANIQSRVTCDTPLVDVVALPCEQGLLLAISNFTSQPLEQFHLTVTDRPVQSVTSVRRGELQFAQRNNAVTFTLPLDATDFAMIR